MLYRQGRSLAWANLLAELVIVQHRCVPDSGPARVVAAGERAAGQRGVAAPPNGMLHGRAALADCSAYRAQDHGDWLARLRVDWLLQVDELKLEFDE